MRRREFLLAAAAAVDCLLSPSKLHAQSSYPSGPIRLIVPFAAGGAVDTVARQWAERVKTILGTVFVENIAGAGGVIGSTQAARQRPDGLTLLFGDTSVLAIGPFLLKQPPYDPSKDLVSISVVAHSASAIVVNPDVPAKSFEEFVRYVKSNQDTISYASGGVGTVNHLAGEFFKQAIGAPAVLHIPYRGMGPAMVDVMAGVVPMATPNMNKQILELHRSGKIRILAVCAPKRLSAAPELPTANETVPGLVIQLTGGVVAPAGVSEPILKQISSATEQVLSDEGFKRWIEDSGLEVSTVLTPKSATEFWQNERMLLQPIIKAAGIQLQ